MKALRARTSLAAIKVLKSIRAVHVCCIAKSTTSEPLQRIDQTPLPTEANQMIPAAYIKICWCSFKCQIKCQFNIRIGCTELKTTIVQSNLSGCRRMACGGTVGKCGVKHNVTEAQLCSTRDALPIDQVTARLQPEMTEITGRVK